MDNPEGKPVCVIVGVGPGNGAANAHKFSDEGYAVAVLARNVACTAELAKSLPTAKAYACNVVQLDKIKEVFPRIVHDLGEVDVLIYSASSRYKAQGSKGNIEDTTEEDMEKAWRIDTLGCMACCKQVIPSMTERAKGTIIILGATGSLRGGANFVAFAAAKNAQRALAESMARHLGPKGVHVCLMIIDGSVDTDKVGDEHLMNPDEVAKAVHYLTTQDKSTWTFKTEVRPFTEKW